MMKFKTKALRILLALVLAIGACLIIALPAAADVTSASVSISDSTAGAVDTDYTINFNVGGDGLAAGVNVHITFPEGTVINSGSLAGTLNTNPIVTIAGNADTRVVSVTSPIEVVSNGAVALVLTAGITNPTTAATNYTVTVYTDAASDGTPVTSQVYTITSGAATHLVVSGDAAMTAGGSNELTVTAKDAYGNTDTAYAGAKNLTFSGPSAAPDTTVATVEGVEIGEITAVTFTAGESNAGEATLVAYAAEVTTVDVTDGTLDTTGDAAYDLDLTVNAGAATHLVVSGDAAMTAGGSNELTVTAKDAYGNTDTAYAGAKDLTFSGPSAAPDTTVATVEGVEIGEITAVTFTAGESNAGEATLVAYAAEVTTVDVTDGTLDTTGDAAYDLDLTVNAGAADSITIDTQPAGVGSVDDALTTQPVVNVKDLYNNNVTNGVTVTAVLVSGTGTLRNTTADTAGGTGNATFTTLGYSKSGETFTVKFTIGAVESATSSDIGALTVGAVASITIVQDPTTDFGINMIISPAITVRAKDGYNNNVAGANIAVILQSGAGSLSGTTNRVTASDGIATFNDLAIDTAGNDKQLRFSMAAITVDSVVFATLPIADLDNLVENLAADLNPGFVAGTYTYVLAAANAEANITLTASLAGATAITYFPGTVNEEVIASGNGKEITLNVGANEITIRITKAGMAAANYSITVTRAAAPIVIPPTPEPEPEPESIVEVSFLQSNDTLQLDEEGITKVSYSASTEDGNLTMVVAEGVQMLDAEGGALETLTVEPLNENVIPPPADTGVIGVQYDFGPDGATFDPPINIVMTYDSSELADGQIEDDLVIAYYDEITGTWIDLECSVDTENHTITGRVSHFTTYAILAKQAESQTVDDPVETVDNSKTTTPAVQTSTPINTKTATTTPDTTNVEVETAGSNSENNMSWWLVVLVLAGAVLVVGLLVMLIRRRNIRK